jgi:mono/diheme cytochrome c family protein
MLRSLLLGAACLAAGAPVPAQESRPEASLTFEKDVRPILKAHCFHCHGEDPGKVKGKLDVRLRHLLVKGGKTGPALVPGRRETSLLFARIAQGEMPPDEKKKLSQEEIETIGRWIDGGARTARPEPPKPPAAGEFTPEERAFWAFQPVRRPDVPAFPGDPRVQTPVDAFLRAALREKGLDFSPEADKATLLRRASFDLTGLPPEPEELAAFLADPAPDAYDRAVDRLLASPRYGERWGRHWLDVAGYADSEGYDESDLERKYAYRYRDYVIRSFNDDKPFDRFIREQLAGDEMVAPPYSNLTPEDADRLAATGFLRMAPDGTGSRGADVRAAAQQVVADTIKIVSTSLLGLTVGCAQCHDHRYDPIPQVDYYRLRAVFEPAYDPSNWRKPAQRLVSLYTDADRKRSAEIEAEAAAVDRERAKQEKEFIEATFERELAKLPEELRAAAREARAAPRDKRTEEQKALLRRYPSLNVSAGSLYLYDKKAADALAKIAARAAEIRSRKKPEEFVPALTEVAGQVPTTRLFYRGDPDQPAEPVAPGGLSILEAAAPAAIPADDPGVPTTGRRLALARWLTDTRHPLTARVIVNRVWMHHFGRGLVNTPGDFGVLGDRPTHPELLDWLASEFIAFGWKLKPLHKLLMTSTAYRQASRRPPPSRDVDPDNRLYARMSVRRLEAEVIRDAMLAAGGTLQARMFGPPVPVMADEVGQIVIGKENRDGEGKVGPPIPLHGEEFRRSVYVQMRRSRPLDVLATFDAPVMEPNCEVRKASTVAPQALMLMNNTFVVTQSRHFARRVAKEAGEEPSARVTRAWRLAFGRDPSDDDVRRGEAFLREQSGHFRALKKADPDFLALSDFCHALLSANRFLYVE